MPQPQRRPQTTRRQPKKEVIDSYNIIKFFALWIVFGLIAFGVKTVVMSAIKMSPTGQVGNGTLTLYEVHNTGAAFNLFAGQPEAIITASMITVLIIAFIVLFASTKINQTALSALAFLNAGITMNMLERMKDGFVTDYIHCDFLQNFPVFNVPDIMIVVGAISLILSILTKK